MATCIIVTKSGGCFRIEEAFMVTTSWVVGKLNGQPFKYQVQDGDSGRFVD